MIDRRWWMTPEIVQWRYMTECGDFEGPLWCFGLPQSNPLAELPHNRYAQPKELTLESVVKMFNSLRQILYINPEDIGHEIVAHLREHGCNIVAPDFMMKGRMVYEDPYTFAVINIESRVVSLGDNPFIKFTSDPSDQTRMLEIWRKEIRR